VLRFDSISSPSQTDWKPVVGQFKYTHGSGFEPQHAISNSLPLHRSKSWRIAVIENGGGYVGVIGSHVDVPAASYTHSLSTVWANCGRCCIVRGEEADSEDGWNGCRSGDVLTFTNNPSNSSVTLHNSRTKLTHTLSTRGLPAVHVHICLFGNISFDISCVEV
jgi:hypothetical protein